MIKCYRCYMFIVVNILTFIHIKYSYIINILFESCHILLDISYMTCINVYIISLYREMPDGCGYMLWRETSSYYQQEYIAGSHWILVSTSWPTAYSSENQCRPHITDPLIIYGLDLIISLFSLLMTIIINHHYHHHHHDQVTK